MFVTENEFELPKGFIDARGNLHRNGVMRLATAADEILPFKDLRVQAVPAYLIIVLMSRVIIKLGAVPQINTGVIEGLFTEDLTFLQRFYNDINGLDRKMAVKCPDCGHEFKAATPAGGSSATP